MEFDEFYKNNEKYLKLKNILTEKNKWEEVSLMLDVINEAMQFGMSILTQELRKKGL